VAVALMQHIGVAQSAVLRTAWCGLLLTVHLAHETCAAGCVTRFDTAVRQRVDIGALTQIIILFYTTLCCVALCACSGKTMLLKALAGQLRGSGSEGVNVSSSSQTLLYKKGILC
jgi:hypothetical protein